MNIAVCGLDCDACAELGKDCQGGCRSHQGKVFWAPFSGYERCPICACAAEKGHAHCGECAALPCEVFTSLREPGLSDEVFNASLRQREENLRGLKT